MALRSRRPEGAVDPALSLPDELVDYETSDLERTSYVMAIAHLYRGELARANAWRLRLDQTTNWAVFTTASALGFAFGNPDATHLSLPFADVLIAVLLLLEARRFRFFDVWRSRLRLIETNFYAPILERRLASPDREWSKKVAQDLNQPHFHLTQMQAVRLRLARNYLPIFGVLLFAWLIKISVHPVASDSWADVYARLAIGNLPGWLTLTVVGAFHVGLVIILVLSRVDRRGRDDWGFGEIVEEEEVI